MHKTIQTVNKAAETFLCDCVSINHDKIKSFKLTDADETNSYFSPPSYLSTITERSGTKEAYRIIHIFNAINASLQYSFFMSRPDIRFDGIDSAWVMRMIDETFAQYGVKSVTDVYRTKDSIIDRLMGSNITMLRSRIETIEELFQKLNFYDYSESYADVDTSIELLSGLICFKQDIFFKKGLLAVMMTNRMLPQLRSLYPYYAQAIDILPVPADYQIPAMLRHYGLIVFDDKLREKIDSDIYLQENSKEELAIRAAAVKACALIAENNGVSADVVDGWLFARKAKSGVGHHLCWTENY